MNIVPIPILNLDQTNSVPYIVSNELTLLNQMNNIINTVLSLTLLHTSGYQPFVNWNNYMYVALISNFNPFIPITYIPVGIIYENTTYDVGESMPFYTTVPPSVNNTIMLLSLISGYVSANPTNILSSLYDEVMSSLTDPSVLRNFTPGDI